MKQAPAVIGFYLAEQENGYLSNWYPAPFYLDGVRFENTEQYMMYRKAMQFVDSKIAMQILQSGAPDEVKRLGRQVNGYVDKVWAGVRQLAMLPALMAKFTQNPALQAQLLSTGDALLAECAPRDLIWGIGLSLDDPAHLDPTQWRGTNLLGFLLMEVRAQLRRNNNVCASASRPWPWNREEDQPCCWFSVNDKQEVTCYDETGGCMTLSAESCQHMQEMAQNGDLPANWERAKLFMEKRNIWDATAFGANMRAICYGQWIDSIGRPSLLIFVSCPEAKRSIYPLLTSADVATCKQNVTLFYQDPEAQRNWQGVILHPVCLMIVKGQKQMFPVSLAHLPAETVQAIRWKGVLSEPVEQAYRTPELFEEADGN